jgi:hypothetical protein
MPADVIIDPESGDYCGIRLCEECDSVELIVELPDIARQTGPTVPARLAGTW